MDNEKLIIDEFMEETFRFPKRLPGKMRKIAEAEMIRYRPVLREANRFLLDDEFVELATELSGKSMPEDMKRRMPIATLPYETTWLEFNLRVKVAKSISMSADPSKPVDPRTPERVGILLQRDRNRPTAWAMTLVGPFDTPKDRGKPITAIAHQAVVLFDASDNGHHHSHPTAGYEPFHITTTRNQVPGKRTMTWIKDMVDPPSMEGQLLTRGLRGFPWGYADSGEIKGTPVGSIIDKSASYTPEFLLRHTQIAVSPMFMKVYDHYDREKDQDGLFEWIKDYTQDLIENTGLLRWVITVLAMLNEVPTRSTQVQPRGSRLMGHSIKGYLDYHRVSLQLPKTKPLSFVQRSIDHAQALHHRAHMVREHWRTYVTERACKPADHDWEYDHPNGYRLCCKCESYGRLIHEHKRGDESLGWVKKEYVLEAGK